MNETITLVSDTRTANHDVHVELVDRDLSVRVFDRSTNRTVMDFTVDVAKWYGEVRMGVLDAVGEVVNRKLVIAEALKLTPRETGLTMTYKPGVTP